jgi:hypothetical protein
VLSRYLMLVLPVLAWLAWRTAEAWWLGSEPSDRRVAGATGAAALIAGLALAQSLAVYRTAVVPQALAFTAGIRQSLVPWGRWFDAHTPAETVIATPDIGAIGYFSRRRVLDEAGLVTPRMIPLLEREPLEEVVAQLRFASFSRPQFIIDRAEIANDLLRRSPYAACLIPIGHATISHLGIARPEGAVYTIYRVDWPIYDRLAPPN